MVKLPKHVIRNARAGGKADFYFIVKPRFRPEGWPATIRLPLDGAKRTRTGDAAEIAQVVIDGNAKNEELARKRETGDTTHPKGTLDWLMDAWRASRHWHGLAGKTKLFYEQGWGHIEKWSAANKQPHVSKVTWPVIFKLVTVYEDRPAVQRQVRNVLQKLTQMAFDNGMITEDPWANQKRRTWGRNTEKRKHMVAKWSDITAMVQLCYRRGYPSMGRAVAVAFDTMQYPADLVGMRFQKEFDSGLFIFDRGKTGVPAIVPASQYTRALIGKADRMFLLEYEGTGRPYSVDLFRKVWRRCIKGSAFEGYQFKWLRHSAVAEADAAGCTEAMNDAMGAWKPGGSGKAVRDSHYRQASAVQADLGMKLREARRRVRTGS